MAEQATTESYLGKDATIAGVGSTTDGAASNGGMQRDDTGDDVAQSTYTARSYQLGSGKPADEPATTLQAAAAQEKMTSDAPSQPYQRDTDLTGAGTIIGAGGVSASDIEADENKPRDQEIDGATYTARSYPMGSGPEAGQSASAPHVPGGFPGDETPVVPGGFPSDDATGPTTTERDLHPGGASFPYESSQQSSKPAEDESTTGRNAALAGAGVAGAGAAGYGIYSATSDEKPAEEKTMIERIKDAVMPSSSKEESAPPKESETAATEPAATSEPAAATTEPEPSTSQPTRPVEETKEDEDHTARNTALAGAGAAGAIGAGYGIHEATKDDESQPEPERKKSMMDKFKERVAPSSSKEDSTESAKSETTATQPTAEAATAESKPTSTEAVGDKKEDEDHTARNTALAGAGVAGAGAAGYGAYEATKDDKPEAEPEQKKSMMDKLKERFKGDKSKDEKASTEESKGTDEKKTEEEDSTGRNAAIAATAAAGTGAAGYGVYEATKDDKAEEAERLKEQERQREQAEQARKQQEKEAEKARKEQQKEAEKAQKEADKKAEKERKEQEKAAQKEQEKAEKARKEEEKKAEKARKQEEEDAKKAQKEEEKRQEKERAAAVAAEEERKKREAEDQRKREEEERKRAEEEEQKRREEEERQRREEEERRQKEEEERKRKEEEESNLGRDAAVGGVAAVGAGAAGYAVYQGINEDGEEKAPAEKLQEYEAQRDAEPKKTPAEKIKSVFTSDKGDEAKGTEGESSTAQEAGVATGSAAAAGAGAYGASEATRDTSEVPHTGSSAAEDTTPANVDVPEGANPPPQWAYEVSKDHPDQASYDDPNLTPAQRLQEYERVRAERNKAAGDSGKKPGLIHRILHPGESRRKSGEEEEPSSPSAPRRASLPPPEEHENYITIVNPDAPEGAPHLTVRDHPEDTK